MFDILIKNAKIFSYGVVNDIVINNSKIISIEEEIKENADRIIRWEKIQFYPGQQKVMHNFFEKALIFDKISNESGSLKEAAGNSYNYLLKKQAPEKYMKEQKIY